MSEIKKQIKAVVEFCPNYLFHLLAVSRAGFDSDYADRYKDTVNAGDNEFIHTHKKLFTIGTQDGGQLTALVAFPVYFQLSSKEDLREFLELFDSSFESDDFGSFEDRYREPVERLKIWYPFETKDLVSMREYREIIILFGKVVLDNYDSYAHEVWPQEQQELEKVEEKINRFFEGRDIIGRWEKLVGLEFKFPVFNIVLCSALKNGPNANSIAYDMVVFYSYDPLDMMTQLISHEVGTHLLFDEFKKMAAPGKYDYGTIYGAYETLARFYNRLVLEIDFPAYNFPDSFNVGQFMKIYERLYAGNPNLNPGEMLRHGLEEFESQFPSGKDS